jgi:hypothetical protein
MASSLDALDNKIDYFRTAEKYPTFLKNRYELYLNEYYWKRIQDVQNYGTSISMFRDDIDSENQQADSELNNVLLSNISDIEKLVFLESLKATVKRNETKLIKQSSDLVSIKESIKLECSDEVVNNVNQILDPYLMYTVPQFQFSAEKGPEIDVKLYVSVNFSETGTYSTSGSIDQSYSDDQELLIAGTGAITMGVMMYFGVTDPNALSAGFAAGAAVMKGLIAINDMFKSSEEYEEQIDKISDKYDDLNNIINTEHLNMRNYSNETVQNSCKSVFGVNDDGEQIAATYLSNLILAHRITKASTAKLYVRFDKNIKLLTKKIDSELIKNFNFLAEIKNIIDQEYIKFSQIEFSNSLSLDRESFDYFLSDMLPISLNINQSETLTKNINNADKFWDMEIEGNSKYSAPEGLQSINYSTLVKNVKMAIGEEIK